MRHRLHADPLAQLRREEHPEQRRLERQHPQPVGAGALGKDRHTVAPRQPGVELRLLPLRLRRPAVDEHRADRPADEADDRPVAHLGLRHQERRRRPLQRHDVEPARMVGDERARLGHRPPVRARTAGRPSAAPAPPRPAPPAPRAGERPPRDPLGQPGRRPRSGRNTAKSPASAAAAQAARSASRSRSASLGGGSAGGSASFQPAVTRRPPGCARRTPGASPSSARCP